jgi:hypothetical protein
VWRNDIERNAWVEKNCRVCFQPDEALARATGGPKVHGCPHLLRSLINKMPTPWKRRRTAPIGETYRCEAFMAKPPVNRRKKSTEETAPLLDVAPDDYNLIPVDGWPDYRAEQRKQKEGDHQ